MNKIIIITGHSGSGKDSISAKLRKVTGIKPLIPYTTRMMRAGESEGDPYHFISVVEFHDMIANNEFLEHKSYTTQFAGFEDTAYYGTAYLSIDYSQPSIITIGVNAAIELKAKLGDKAILIYLDTDDETRKQRAEQRGSFDLIEWNNRLSQDHARFNHQVPTSIEHVIDNTGPMDLTIQNILTLLKD